MFLPLLDTICLITFVRQATFAPQEPHQELLTHARGVHTTTTWVPKTQIHACRHRQDSTNLRLLLPHLTRQRRALPDTFAKWDLGQQHLLVDILL